MLSTLHTQGHTFRPLPAKDAHGHQILPRLYASVLPQALVSIKFQISRHFVETSKCYDYFAEIVDLKILSHTNIISDVKTDAQRVPSKRKQDP